MLQYALGTAVALLRGLLQPMDGSGGNMKIIFFTLRFTSPVLSYSGQ